MTERECVLREIVLRMRERDQRVSRDRQTDIERQRQTETERGRETERVCVY